MVSIFMILAKSTTLGLLKIDIFWNKGYDVIISIHDVTNKILPCAFDLIVDVAMWSKSANSSTFIRKVILTSVLSRLN